MLIYVFPKEPWRPSRKKKGFDGAMSYDECHCRPEKNTRDFLCLAVVGGENIEKMRIRGKHKHMHAWMQQTKIGSRNHEVPTGYPLMGRGSEASILGRPGNSGHGGNRSKISFTVTTPKRSKYQNGRECQSILEFSKPWARGPSQILGAS